MDNRTPRSKAESRYWDAFERLKSNSPTILPPGSDVSQNNVAKEAGRNPSALRANRFPTLADAIATYIEKNPIKKSKHPETQRQSSKSTQSRNRTTIAEIKKQRDHALSKLAEAEALIVRLVRENRVLQDLHGSPNKKSDNILHFPQKD